MPDLSNSRIFLLADTTPKEHHEEDVEIVHNVEANLSVGIARVQVDHRLSQPIAVASVVSVGNPTEIKTQSSAGIPVGRRGRTLVNETIEQALKLFVLHFTVKI